MLHPPCLVGVVTYCVAYQCIRKYKDRFRINMIIQVFLIFMDKLVLAMAVVEARLGLLTLFRVFVHGISAPSNIEPLEARHLHCYVLGVSLFSFAMIFFFVSVYTFLSSS